MPLIARDITPIQPVVPPQPTGLFQTRITRTPGGVVPPMASGALGGFDPNQSPLAVIAASNLPPDQKAILMRSWAPQGPGFIGVTPGSVGDPTVMRHEQIHQLQSTTPTLSDHAAQIAALVNPAIIGGMHKSPVYQAEMRAQGQTPIEAKEGTALDLVPGLVSGLKDSPTQALRDYHMQLLKNDLQKRKQFERLTDVTQLPGRS